MKNNLYLLLTLLPLAGFSQELRGTIWSNSYSVENVSINNVSLKTHTFADSEGKFVIAARERDTLEFSSMNMQPKMLVVRGEHLEQPVLIQVEPRATQIEEITVHGYKLTGNLEKDSKGIKVPEKFIISLGMTPSEIQALQFSPDQQSGVKNDALPPANQPFMGINVLEVAKMIFGPSKPKVDQAREKAYKGEVFVKTVRTRYADWVFTDTMQIDEDQIGLFLQYCSAHQPENSALLEAGNELKLTEFLLESAKAFREGK